MGRDYLDPNLVEAQPTCARRSTLAITLGDGTPLYLATSDIEFGGIVYLGKLAPLGELNLELTRAAEGINFLVSNRTLVFGQNLINTPNVLNNTRAKLGTYFREGTEEWHDVKIRGVIKTGKIDREWVNITFKSITSATRYNGKTVASVCPDTEIPSAFQVVAPPAPVYDDLSNVPVNGNIPDERFYSFENERYYGRHFLPMKLRLIARDL